MTGLELTKRLEELLNLMIDTCQEYRPEITRAEALAEIIDAAVDQRLKEKK